MFEQRTLRDGIKRNGETLGLVLLQWFALEEWNHLIEDRGISGGANIMCSDERKPEKIVTDPRPDTHARVRVPPVLDIAFHELACGGAQNVAARKRGRRMHKRHHVLQLVAESVGAARLIKGRAAPDPATESLIRQPAIE